MPVPFALVRMAVHMGVAKWLPAVRKRLGPIADSLHYLSDRVLATPLQQLDDVARRHLSFDGRVMDLSGLPGWTVLSRPSPVMRVDGECPSAGLTLLRERIVDEFTHETGITFDVDQETIVTPGGRGAIHIIADTFLNRRDRVVVFDPSSPLFIDAVRHRRATIRWVPTSNGDDGLQAEEDTLRRALAGAKLLFMSLPAGPSGQYWSPLTLEAITRWANRYDVLVVWDRSLSRWSCESMPSEFPWLTALRQRVMVVQRVAAGVGVIAGPVGLVQPCCLTSQAMMAPVPSAVQQLALPQVGESEVESIRDDRAKLRDDIVQRLESLGLKCVMPRCGPFAWLDVSKLKMTGRTFCERVARAGVTMTAGDRCGPSGKYFVRLTWAGDEGRFNEGMRRLEESVRCINIEAIPTNS